MDGSGTKIESHACHQSVPLSRYTASKYMFCQMLLQDPYNRPSIFYIRYLAQVAWASNGSMLSVIPAVFSSSVQISASAHKKKAVSLCAWFLPDAPIQGDGVLHCNTKN